MRPLYEADVGKRRGDACALQKLREMEQVSALFCTKCFWSAMRLRIAFNAVATQKDRIEFNSGVGMQLVLKKCTIRPWRLDDAESVARHANNRKVWLAVRDTFPHPYTIDDAHEFIRGAIAEQPATRFCIEINGAAVGGIGVHPGQDVHRPYCNSGVLARRGVLGTRHHD